MKSIIEEDNSNNDGVSQLPDNFLDAIERAASTSYRCFSSGANKRIRIGFVKLSINYYFFVDFDTSIGDMTYTSIKNTMPVVKELLKSLTSKLQISDIVNNNDSSNSIRTDKTIRVFFPDMGAAVLARRDWKMNTPEAEVPLCVYTGFIINILLLI